ncbi:MAG: glycerophosphodiester phosphodiesterase, partial [Pirellulales bacterium]
MATTAAQVVAAPRVLVIAHRGDSCVAPENTLPAFESALALGVDVVELDYRHTADGVPVAIHD